MFIGTQIQKWILLAILASLGCFLAYIFPDPVDTERRWFLVLLSLVFAKNWLEYLLFLPITGLKGLYIGTRERKKRKRFFILSVLIYIALMIWLASLV